ncbi:hypothetical protein ACTHO0_09640 [Cytobacillus praedii]|uniref:hypothetical protein n=1 Tax=Cytobacillus praedii TaxID=1742358 RepID=UPI003F7FB220
MKFIDPSTLSGGYRHILLNGISNFAIFKAFTILLGILYYNSLMGNQFLIKKQLK